MCRGKGLPARGKTNQPALTRLTGRIDDGFHPARHPVKKASITVDRTHPTGLVDLKTIQQWGQMIRDGPWFVQPHLPARPVDQGQVLVPSHGQHASSPLDTLLANGAEPGWFDMRLIALFNTFLDAGKVAILGPIAPAPLEWDSDPHRPCRPGLRPHPAGPGI